MSTQKQLKTVIVVRKDLDLPLGKWIAQSVHATMRAVAQQSIQQTSDPYDSELSPICIVCYVKSEAKLLKLFEKVKDAGIVCGLQRDAGHNFVAPNTPTVLSIGPDETAKIEPITKKLQLLKI